MRQLEAASQKLHAFLKLPKRFKQSILSLSCLASLSACTIVPNEGPTECGLESMDNALFRDIGCDPITGIISIPYVVLVFAVDYAGCGPKWHNSRVALDVDGKDKRYLRRLRQMKLEAERNQSALEAQRSLASQTLAVNAIANRLYTILTAKAAAINPPPLSMKDNKAARKLAENAVSEQFTIALEQILRIQNNLKLAHDRELAAMPQDQDLLPALADPGQKEASSYSVVELEKSAWAQVTADDKIEKAKRQQEKIAQLPPERRAAYEAKQAKKAQQQEAKRQKKAQRQADKTAQLQAKLAAKHAKAEAKRQAVLQAKGEAEPVPMNPQTHPAPPASSAPSSPAPNTPAPEEKTASQKDALLQQAAQQPVAPLVRKAETVKPDSKALKAQIQLNKNLPLPLHNIPQS
ncbi:hypothetical protein FAI41_03550 [Acetobacteraceae bacterium]|nr:hypothetical protein FAI41_03550 [Acetobacteraceae bacterium]